MPQARIDAAIGLDNSQYKRGIDGAKRENAGFSASLRSIRQGMHFAFAIYGLQSFLSAMKTARQDAEKFPGLISPSQLRDLESAASVFDRLHVQAKLMVMSWVSNFIHGIQFVAARLGAFFSGSSWSESREIALKQLEDEQKAALAVEDSTRRRKTLLEEIAKLEKEMVDLRRKELTTDQQIIAAYNEMDYARRRMDRYQKSGRTTPEEKEQAILDYNVKQEKYHALIAKHAQERLTVEEKIRKQKEEAAQAEVEATEAEWQALDKMAKEQSSRDQQLADARAGKGITGTLYSNADQMQRMGGYMRPGALIRLHAGPAEKQLAVTERIKSLMEQFAKNPLNLGGLDE